MSRLARALLLAFAGCGGVVPPPPPDAGPATSPWPQGRFVLGSIGADGGFSTLPTSLEATAGAQGGYHLPVTYRVEGQALTSDVRFEHRVRRARDEKLVSRGTRDFPLVGGSTWTPSGPVILFICPTPVGVSVLGEELRFEVTASRDGLELGRATATTRLECPPGDPSCAAVCGG